MADLDDAHELKLRSEVSLRLLNEYSWLLDAYILDFFTEKHMEKLPKSWQQYIKSTSLEDISYVLNMSQEKSSHSCPLSILCIRTLIQYLSLSREVNRTCNSSLYECMKRNKVNFSRNMPIFQNKTGRILPCSNVWNLFLKHVKPKKRYEIFRLAEASAEIAKKLKVQCVVDVGSGLGHLSRIMAYGFNLNVCSIETQPELISQAIKLDTEFETAISKYLNDSEKKYLKTKRPVYFNQQITFDLVSSNFINDLKTLFAKDVKDFRIGIMGLHPCGDLAAILLQLYKTCSEAKFINLISCCYHKLTTACESRGQIGFPLTTFYAEKLLNISYEARALACHAIENYCERLKSNNYAHLKIHCYRAALEKIISKNWNQYRKCQLSNVKYGDNLDFKLYCQVALKKLNIKVPEEDLTSVETVDNLAHWQDVVKFYALRLMFAPLVETAILLDRLLYLIEKGISTRIVVVFDPKISPRNQMLVSEKTG